jgi:hypothetical protein
MYPYLHWKNWSCPCTEFASIEELALCSWPIYRDLSWSVTVQLCWMVCHPGWHHKHGNQNSGSKYDQMSPCFLTGIHKHGDNIRMLDALPSKMTPDCPPSSFLTVSLATVIIRRGQLTWLITRFTKSIIWNPGNRAEGITFSISRYSRLLQTRL